MSTVILLQRKNGTASVPYKLLPPEAVFANILGLLIILFGMLVLYALAKPSWKRPEADSLDTHQVLALLWGCSQYGFEELSWGSAPAPHSPSWLIFRVGVAGSTV